MMDTTMQTPELTVYTYGSPETLEYIFRAISMLFYGAEGTGSFVMPLMRLCACFGILYAIYQAFFGSTFSDIILRYLIPLLCVNFLFIMPSANVHIEDILLKKEYHKSQSIKVDQVPRFLAFFAQTVSTFARHITTAIETVMHLPGDPNYNSTGLVFGSETALDFRKYRLNNSDLADAFRSFCKQCVFFDVGIGLYSMNELQNTDDLWKFFGERSSTQRMIRYCPTQGIDKGKCLYLTCRDAIKKLQPEFEKEKEFYAKTEVGRNLPLTLQALGNLQQSSSDLISQQLMFNMLADNFDEDFAKDRARMGQNTNYRTFGSLAGQNLVVMRSVFEGLIYAAFIIILPLSALPGGFSYFKNWMVLVVWIQLWAPFFAIIKFIMAIQSKYILGGLAGKSLCILTSIGLQNLHEDMFALAGYLSLSVPFLSFMVLQNSVHQVSQLASSLMGPTQTAASSAAQELSSGNYSYSNVGFGQMTYENDSFFQFNRAPSLSSGYMTENQGTSTTTYGSDGETIYKQDSSSLPYNLSNTQTLGENLQTQLQSAESYVKTEEKGYSDSIAKMINNAHNSINYLSDDKNFNDSYSSTDKQDIQESVSNIKTTAANWGKNYGLNQQESVNVINGATIGGSLGAGVAIDKVFSMRGEAGLSRTRQDGFGASREEMMSSAVNVSKDMSLQKSWQNLKDFAKNTSASETQNSGTRISTDFTQGLNDTQSHQESHQAALSRLKHVSETVSFYEQHSQDINQNHTQQFVQWCQAELGGDIHEFKRLSLSSNPSDQKQMQRFVVNYMQKLQKEYQSISAPASYQNPQEAYANAHVPTIDKKAEINEINKKYNHKASGQNITTKRDGLIQEFQNEKTDYEMKQITTKDHIQYKEDNSKRQLINEQNRELKDSAWAGADKYLPDDQVPDTRKK
jgi:conjugal transfer mating pair stabilization protein TraG